MKIALYISSLGKGGAERVISNLANYYSNDSNNEVYLILETPIIEYKINDNINIITLDKNNTKRNFLTKKLRYLKYIYKLKKLFKKINTDLIISFLPMSIFVSLLSKNKNSKVIISVRNDPKIEYRTFFMKKMMKYLYPKADGIVFQTKEAKDYFKNIVFCKQTIIYNAISGDFLNNKDVKKKKKEIVTVGRLQPQKNHLLLIDAFEDISKKYRDYNLIIYGEGSERERLQAAIDSKKLSKRVFLAGNVDNVKEHIYNATLFIMTSDYEGMPNSLIEAMILGLPVISTDCPCGGPRELITSGKNGLLVEVGNKENLVNAICRILDNEKFANKMGEEAKKISNKVNPDSIHKQWDRFIKEILK